jgi:hypothetical protein
MESRTMIQRPNMKRRLFILVFGLVAVSATAFAGVAANKPAKIRFTAAGQAEARAAVLHSRADLMGLGPWRGGLVKWTQTPPPACTSRPVDLSRLVVTGAARSAWSGTATRWNGINGGPDVVLDVSSEAQVFQSNKMAELSWGLPGAAMNPPCFRKEIAKALAAQGIKYLSDEPFAPWWHSDQLPTFPPHVAATRVWANRAGVRTLLLLVSFYKGRTVVSLAVMGPAAKKGVIELAVANWQGRLAFRIPST